MVVTQKLSVSTLPKVESRPEFAQDHESGLGSDRGPVVLCDFSKLRFLKSPYEFLTLYVRFFPYNPPYNPGHDTLPSKMRVEIFTQRKKNSTQVDKFRVYYTVSIYSCYNPKRTNLSPSITSSVFIFFEKNPSTNLPRNVRRIQIRSQNGQGVNT
jgi:hypothetical protein